MAVLCAMLFHCPMAVLAAQGSINGGDHSSINPIGVTFEYKLAWVDVKSSTFGVSVQAAAHSQKAKDTNWILLLRYDKETQANVTKISSGWELDTYDYASWMFIPGDKPYDQLYFTARSGAKMNTEDTVRKYAEPAQVYLMFVNQGSSTEDMAAYVLRKGSDYTLNQGVNLSEIPNKAFGPWLSLPDPVADTSLDETVSRTVKDGGNGVNAATPSTQHINVATTPTSTTASSKDMPTVIAPAKYIPGNPNYDKNTDPLGTMLAAPRTGLYLTSVILGIGILAHIAGTIHRFRFKRQFHNSVGRSKAGLSFA